MGLYKSALSLGREVPTENEDAKINGIHALSSLAYSQDASGGHFLDIIWSKEPLNPLPTVIYFNGATFTHTNRSRSGDLCRVIAKRGYLVINAEFRDLRKNVGIKEQIEDIRMIFHWIDTNHERFNIDLDKVYIVGSTYGALMALWTAMMFNSGRLRNIVKIEEPGIRIRGLGLFTGMTDIYSGETRMRTIGAAFRELLDDDPELAHVLDAWSNHDLREMPPIFQATGEYDSARTDVAKLDELFDNNIIPHETITFEGSERLVRSFMEKRPFSNEAARVLSRMFTFFKDNQ